LFTRGGRLQKVPNCCEFILKVAGGLQSKKNAGLSEQQQGYLFQMNVVDSIQAFTTSTHLNYTLTSITLA